MSITKDPAKKNPSQPQPSARETHKDQPLHSARPENKSPQKNPNPSNPQQQKEKEKERNAWK